MKKIVHNVNFGKNLIKSLNDKMKCQYNGCTEEASYKLGLADPDAEGNYYCEGHVDTRKHEITMELFGWERRKCIAITGNGKRCLNDKKFGQYCGIHLKNKPKQIVSQDEI